MRSPVSRRSLLLLGGSGAGLSLLSACGLRLDTAPDVPTLDATQELRNRIARILAATTAGSGDPATAGEDLAKFRDAIGPVWSPPSEMATEAPPTEISRTYIDAAEVVSSAVFEVIPQLRPSLIPVLVDVATGMTLTAGTRKAGLIDTADGLIQDSRTAGDEAGQSPSSEPSGGKDSTTTRREHKDSDGTDKDSGHHKIWNSILDAARAASYGYERLAVKFDTKSPERKGAVARLESLGSLAGEMLEKLGESAADPDAAAWKLDPSPTDAASSSELALSLEDSLAAAILPWLAADPLATLRLWESARTRTVFADAQALRYSYSGKSGVAEATS